MLRSCGCDEYDDFDLMVMVHDANFTATSRKTTKVRITAGRQQIETNDNAKGIFQEPLQLAVEQGTQHIVVDLMESRTVMAQIKIDVMTEILQGGKIIEKEYSLKPKIKQLSNPRVKLSFHAGKDADVEKGLLSDMNLTKESAMILQQSLLKGKDRAGPSGATAEPLNPAQALAMGIKGNLEMFGTLGTCTKVYVAVSGPPATKKYIFSVFDDEKSHLKGEKPKLEVELMKILSVQEDPGRPDVFLVNYVDSRKNRERLSFRRLDLPTATWVELITKLIRLIREEREASDRKKASAGK